MRLAAGRVSKSGWNRQFVNYKIGEMRPDGYIRLVDYAVIVIGAEKCRRMT